MRVLAVVSALVSFYVTYLAYRNLKSVVPLLRPGDLFDAQLADARPQPVRRPRPRRAAARRCSARGIAAHALSGVYMLFFLFIPLTLASRSSFCRTCARASSSRTALALNWLLGAGELLPAAVARADLRRARPRSPASRAPASSAPAGDAARAAAGVPARPVRRGPRRASAPSPRCTCRSSSPPRWPRTCSGCARYVKIARVGPVRADRRRDDLLRLALRRSTTSPAWPSP